MRFKIAIIIIEIVKKNLLHQVSVVPAVAAITISNILSGMVGQYMFYKNINTIAASNIYEFTSIPSLQVSILKKGVNILLSDTVATTVAK